MPLQKYFVAVVLTEPGLSKAEAIKNGLFRDYGLKGALRCPSHITLHRPFVWKDEKENLLLDKLISFDASPAFNIELRDFSFFEPRVIYLNVVPNDHLADLHRRFTLFAKQELNLFNEADDLRGFHPHVTVASRDLKKNLFAELKPLFSEQPFSADFTMQGISLLKLNKFWEILKYFPI